MEVVLRTYTAWCCLLRPVPSDDFTVGDRPIYQPKAAASGFIMPAFFFLYLFHLLVVHQSSCVTWVHGSYHLGL